MLKTALNFNWNFIQDFKPDYINTFIPTETIDVPHTVKELPKNYFDETLTQSITTYQQQFSYNLKKHHRLFIVFEGVMSKATIYLNGHEIGSHVGGYTTFKLELTDYLDKENLLTVKVDAFEQADHPPFGHVIDYLTYGGIYREVTLVETYKDTVEHALIDGTHDTFNARIKLNKQTENALNVTILLFDNDEVIYRFSQKTTDTELTFKESVDLICWHITNPKRYFVQILIDDYIVYESNVGFRTIHVDQNHFYLNDEIIFLRGLNRHQSFPYVGYAMPKSAQAKDADILKYDLGVNIVRSSHYPPSKHFLDRCDEIGLLVFTELPGWQHIGDETWKNHALNDLKSLLINDYNHPSIVIIGTRINESKDDDDFYTRTNALAKSIDPTRPTGGVRFFGKSNLLEDIYTLNDFVHRGDNEGLSKKHKMTDKKNPYLITEFNGHMFPTKSFDDETKRINHAKRHFKVLDDAYKMDGIMGAIGWCMNDYNTHKDFGSNDHICYHGVLDMNRNPKYAASVYRAQSDTPYLNILSMMHIGEMPGGELKEVIVATNCEEIKLYKNDTLIATYTNQASPYKHLPNPPIVINDLIGNQIEKNEIFNKKDAKRIKNILLKTLENGLKMSLSTKLKMGYLLAKYKLTYDDAVTLYTKYIGGWGETTNTYKFEGYKAGELVKTVYKGHNDEYALNITQDTKTLTPKDTYDTTRITVELLNAYLERSVYSHEVITIKTSDHISLIGPSTRTLQGGIESFWVKSKKKGKASIEIKSNHYGTHHLTLDVQ